MSFLILVFVVLAVVTGCVGLAYLSAVKQQRATEIRKRISDEYKPDKVFVSPFDFSFIGIAHNDRKIIVGKRDLIKSYPFSMIGKVEVIHNEVSVGSTNRGSQAAGAAVGGVLFGGVGALAGALSGSTTTAQGVRKIVLRITVDDIERPFWDVLFFRTTAQQGLDIDSHLLSSITGELDHFNALLFNIVHRQVAGPLQPTSPT